MIFAEGVPTLLPEADRLSVLTLRDVVADRFGAYSYFEVGSYLGGTLQPHLLEPRCVVVYSIDPRPEESPDIRTPTITYPQNTTAEMRRILAAAHGDSVLAKLRTFELDARDVPTAQIDVPPRLCYIDGEHTDRAVLSDFDACLSRADRPCVVAFDDADLVYGGIGRCLELLRERNVEHVGYLLPAKTAVVEVGGVGLWRDERILRLIVTMDAYLSLTRTMEAWRLQAVEYERWKSAVRAVPGARYIARAVRTALR